MLNSYDFVYCIQGGFYSRTYKAKEGDVYHESRYTFDLTEYKVLPEYPENGE